VLGLIAGTLTYASSMGTNDYFADGYGIKAEGEAGAGIAFPQDSLTIATNPAGLVALPNTFDVGADIFKPKRDATLVQGGGTQTYDGNGISTFYVPAIGYPRHLTQNLAAGVALFGNGGLDTYYIGNPFSRFGATGTAGVDLQQAFLSPALAWQANPQNAVGLAVNVGYQRFRAIGIGLFSGFSQNPYHVSDQGYDIAYGAGVRVGWIGHVNQYLAVGATWQSTTWMQKFKKYAGLFANSGDFDAPSTYGVGLALTPSTA
jgi:long-chain fatty acid transport protein